MSENEIKRPTIVETGEATAIMPARNSSGKPITVIGTQSIRDCFDASGLEQALNSPCSTGITDLVLNPDAHKS